MTTTAEWLKKWFAEHAPDIALAGGDNFFDQEAIDSFGIIELIETVEREFGIRFTNQMFQDRRFPTIDGLAAIIEEIRADGHGGL